MLVTFGSLCQALQFAYPERKWDDKKFSFIGKKSVQRYREGRKEKDGEGGEGRGRDGGVAYFILDGCLSKQSVSSQKTPQFSKTFCFQFEFSPTK
jgi:hypothetical protein